MFDKISSKSLKRVLVLKYIVQLLVMPFIFGLILNLISFVLGIIAFDFNYMMNYLFGKYTIWGIDVYGWFFAMTCMYLINLMTNGLSILPFCKLILDCILKESEEMKEIELLNEMPPYELQSIRQSKRFMCDTFSRKRNVELFIYDENKTKYRVFWNESYGSYEKAEQIICDGKRLKISYFKRSKIIFRCELIE